MHLIIAGCFIEAEVEDQYLVPGKSVHEMLIVDVINGGKETIQWHRIDEVVVGDATMGCDCNLSFCVNRDHLLIQEHVVFRQILSQGINKHFGPFLGIQESGVVTSLILLLEVANDLLKVRIGEETPHGICIE
ncbi:hypothetical protein D3C77_512360 [compost metagenome]